MTDYQYPKTADVDTATFTQILAISEGNDSGKPSKTGDYIFLQCTEIKIDGERLTPTKYIASRTSYNTRTAKKKHTFTFKGIVVKNDTTSITNDTATIAKFLDVQMGGVAPYYAYILMYDGTTRTYFPFSSSTGSFVTYLKGYVERFSIEPKQGNKIYISGTFGECQT